MAFTEIKIMRSGPGRKKLVNTVKACIAENDTLRIVMSEDIYLKTGEPVFMKAMVGSGEDDGFISLAKVNVETSTTRRVLAVGTSSKCKQVHLKPASVGLSKTAVSSIAVPHEITEDGIIIDLRQIFAAQSPS